MIVWKIGEKAMGNVNLNPCLGERFFDTHVTSTRNIFKLKNGRKLIIGLKDQKKQLKRVEKFYAYELL